MTVVPQVSVVIPTYNMEAHIAETIRSIQDQTFQDFEVIVVDDCSTDGTGAIVRAMADQDSRIRYVLMEANSNLPAVPRNLGIEIARGEYVAFLDHDDLWTKHKLERQVSVLDANPEIGLVHSHLMVMVEGRPLRGLVHLPDPRLQHADYAIMRRRNVVMTSSAMARRAVLQVLGGFDESRELRTVEDYHLWIRISESHEMAYIPEIHGRYRKAPGGASNQEVLSDRSGVIDRLLGTDIVANTPTTAARLRRKVVGYPRAFYAHVVNGSIRQWRGAEPRTW